MNKLFPVMMLAGGLATRLRPLTETVPKPLLTINGEPFIAHQLRLLQSKGVKELLLCVGYLGEMIEDFVGDGSLFGIRVSYVYDGDALLGTGGAIKQALALTDLGAEDAFFVIYGDSYLPCDYWAVQKHFGASNRLAQMTVFKNQGQWDASNVEFQNGIIQCYDKVQRNARMHYIDYGLGIFKAAAFEMIPLGQPVDLAEIYQMLLKKGELAAYEVKERFYEAGSFAGIKELEYYLTRNEELEVL